jgi:hypothetical protein
MYGLHYGFAPHIVWVQLNMGHCGSSDEVHTLYTRIHELKELWNRVKAYDSHKKQKFTLCATYLWSIHDFMVYSIFVG